MNSDIDIQVAVVIECIVWSARRSLLPKAINLELASCCTAGIWQKSTKYVGLVYNILGFTEDSVCGREITECAIFFRVYIKANLSQSEWTVSFKAFTCTPLLFEWKLFVNNLTNFPCQITGNMKLLATKLSHHLGAKLFTISKCIL